MSYIINSGKIWKPFQSDLFEGHSPFVEAKEGAPVIRWRGAKIPLTVWHTIIAFFLQHKEHEVQVRLYYNQTTREWMPHAFPQRYGTGMTTSELGDHANMAADLAIFTDPWLYMGTVHHHCSASAFQSGTDKGNEETIVGLHMTVGHLGQAKLDIHSRVSMKFPGELSETGAVIRPGIQHFFENPPLIDWFELPQALVTLLPAATHNEIITAIMKTPVGNEVGFPARWSENLIRFQHAPYQYTPYNPGGYQHHHREHGFGEWDQAHQNNYGRQPVGGEPAGEFGSRWDHQLPSGSLTPAGGVQPQQAGGASGAERQLEMEADEQWTVEMITARSEPVIHPTEGMVGYDFDLKYMWQWLEFANYTAAATFLVKHGYSTTIEGTWCTTDQVLKINSAYTAQRAVEAAANGKAKEEATYEGEGGNHAHGGL